MSKSLEYYRDNENDDLIDEKIENPGIIEQSFIEECIKNDSNFKKFIEKYKKIKIGEKLDSLKNLICFLVKNHHETKDLSFVKSFLKFSFKELCQNFRENSYDYPILQKQWDLLDCCKNCKVGEFNEVIIDEEITLVEEKMKNFLLRQNKMKKKKKNFKIKQRLERRKEKLQQEILDNESKIKDEKNIETISLD